MRRLIVLILLIGLFPLIYLAFASTAPQAQKSETDAAFEKSIQPFFSDYCYECHNEKLKKGNLNLETFQSAASLLQDRDTWEKVLEKLHRGEMPPKEAPRPDQSEVEPVTRWIESEFDRADRLAGPDPGRVTARRLNRAEYNNTVRDLLGVSVRPADDFPQDDSGYGFDNIGDVLSLSPVLMEKYLAAAEKVARTALYGPELLKPTLVRLRTAARRDLPNSPLSDYDASGLSLPNSLHVTCRFPVDGEHLFKAVLNGHRPRGSEPARLAFWIDARQVQAIEVDLADFEGQTREFRTNINAGEHLVSFSFVRFYDGLPSTYGGPNPSSRPIPPPPDFSSFKPPENATQQQLEEYKKKQEALKTRSAQKEPVDARVNYVEIGGPFKQARGPSLDSLKKIYTCGHVDGVHQRGCDRKIVAGLAHRAFRRPVTSQEVERLTGLISMAQKRGDSFEEGICLALQAMLVSPHFLFRIENRGKATGLQEAHLISQHELAARLSYFLWSSMPDEELLRCADQQILRKPDILAAQVRRMLKDSKSHALIENFGGQWLELRRLEIVKPDPKRFPEFDEYLRQLMRRETEMFFEAIVREDRSILDFIDAKYTFLNDRLAQHYKIPAVTGAEFRKVDLNGTPRGGILTQASILTVSSYATRTSPVLRGRWILENILNAPPPPPPAAGVPALNEAAVGVSASMRQQLEQHRTNPACASCHARMDTLGFALENYNAIGAWRTEDGKFPVEASGSLPDGRSFRGLDDLKAILKHDRDAFAECLTQKLLTYSLGRGIERYDRRTVKTIASSLAANEYRFSSLVLEIANSVPFQMRRGDLPK